MVSVGGSIAAGLESGIRTGMAMRNAEDDRATRKGLLARQQMLDQQHQEDRARLLTRQSEADEAAALEGQAGSLRGEVETSMQPGAAPLQPARQAQITTAAKTIADKRQNLFVKRGGVDFAALRKKTDEQIAALREGRLDPETMAGPDFGRVFSTATGHPLKSYVREGGPAPIEQAAADIHEGIAGQDNERTVRGLNVLFTPELQRGLGEDSPHGGKIIAKRIVDVHMDPRSTPDDPRVVPMIQVFVNNGKAVKTNGGLGRMDHLVENGSPNGATGHYFAPLTENRTSDPNDPVKSISIKAAMDRIGQHLQLVEGINTPQGLQKVQEAYASPGETPDDWLQAMSILGVKPSTTKKVSLHSIPAGGSLAQVTEDSRGNVTTKITQGNPKPPSANDPVSRMQFQLDEIDAAEEAGELTKAQANVERRAVRSGIKPGKYSGMGATAGSAGGPGLKERKADLEERKADLASLDKDVDAADKRADNARAALSSHVKEKPDKFSDAAAISAWEAEHERLKKRVATADAAHEEAVLAKKGAQSEYQRAKTSTGGPDKTGAKAPPAVGTVKGGYRFKGGNPALPANWVKV